MYQINLSHSWAHSWITTKLKNPRTPLQQYWLSKLTSPLFLSLPTNIYQNPHISRSRGQYILRCTYTIPRNILKRCNQKKKKRNTPLQQVIVWLWYLLLNYEIVFVNELIHTVHVSYYLCMPFGCCDYQVLLVSYVSVPTGHIARMQLTNYSPIVDISSLFCSSFSHDIDNIEYNSIE